MPTLARCPYGCTMLRYYGNRCQKHESQFRRVYITEGELDYVKKILLDNDPVHGRRFGREQDLEHKQFAFRELDRLHRVSTEG